MTGALGPLGRWEGLANGAKVAASGGAVPKRAAPAGPSASFLVYSRSWSDTPANPSRVARNARWAVNSGVSRR